MFHGDLLMYIADKKAINQEYFLHASIIKSRFENSKKHEENRIKGFEENDRRLELKKIILDKHEDIKIKNMIALNKEEDQKIDFVKKSLGLNII